MRVRSIDLNNDWNFGKGQNDYLKDQDAIAQNIKTRLQSFLGDCFFAINDGIDWFNILGSKNQIAFELAVRAQILNTDGVTGIVSTDFLLDPYTRRATLTYTVNTIFTGVVNTAQNSISGTVSFLGTEDGSILTTEDGTSLTLG